MRLSGVNVTALMNQGAESSHPHSLTDDEFGSLFSEGVPIHFNHHGYANELKGLFFGRPNVDRVSTASYMVEGSMTTPFNMMLVNETSRFGVAKAAVKGTAKKNERVSLQQHELLSELNHEIKCITKTIIKTKTGEFPVTSEFGRPGQHDGSQILDFLADVDESKVDNTSLSERLEIRC
jgi:xylulose-5-phosphate/fructose-6-phosphate phosphoketolase